MKFSNLTIPQIHSRLLKKEFSAVELTKFYLNKIKEKNKEIFAYLTVSEDLAISQAKKADEIVSKEKQVPLLVGIPVAVKDNILVEGEKCTAASKILGKYTAPSDAIVIKRLKQQGAVILGKTNLDEFAMGGSCERSAFGPTKNPHDLSRVPGGSSGGSAAAVAADMAVYSLGSDTGGSIRQPASFCGVVGLKPTYGAVSRYGLIAYASSLDQIGPITKTVEDAKIVLDVIAGKEEMDSTSIEIKSKIQNPKSKIQIKSKIQNLKIGLPKEYFGKGVDAGVEKVIKKAIKKFEEMGAEVEEISLPHTKYALPCYYIIAPSEASANLARYDGIKYGLSAKGKDLMDVYIKTRGEGFGEEVRRRIMLGTYALSAGYYEAYYLRAQKVRTLVKQDFEKAFEKIDVILTPVSPTPAFKIGEKITSPLTMYLADVFTIAVNLAGVPALSVPVGKVGNLPVGLQIIGKPLDDYKILEVGQIFENT